MQVSSLKRKRPEWDLQRESNRDSGDHKKKDLRAAGLSLGEDKVFLYLSHYRSSGGNKYFGMKVVYPHFCCLYKKGFEKYVYMSYTM